jgi:hypothetical protein
MLRRLDRLFSLAFLMASTAAANGQTFAPAVPQPESPTSRITLTTQRPNLKFQLYNESTPVSSAASSALSSKYDFSVPLGGLNGCNNNTYFDIVPGCQGKQAGPKSSGSPPSVDPPPPALKSAKSQGIRWGHVLLQSFEFISIEHGLRMAFDPPSRRAMSNAIENGEFWQAYVRSLKTLHGWSDGNHFFVNYVGHPLQGAVTGFILIHNDPKGMNLQFGHQRAYWVSRAKAMGWATVYSIYWELGFPLSEAAIGNLGPEGRPGLGAVDLVITETVGTTYLVAEDVLDLYVVRAVERKWCRPGVTAMARSVLNLNHAFSNLLRWKFPWYRDTRGGLRSCGN